MINDNKWINSLPNSNPKQNHELIQIDNDKWINTIPKKSTYSSVKKYSFITVAFVCGLLIVSAIKNQTRNLEKEINYLKASIGLIEFNLNQATLDNQVITSPENISILVKEHLNFDLSYYKKSQIKNLNADNKIENKMNEKNNAKNLNNLKDTVKSEVAIKIKEKKKELAKLQELYKNPKSIPSEVKTKVAKQIERKKFELKNLYEAPKELITLKRVGKWGAVQVVKAALGMPVIPGR